MHEKRTNLRRVGEVKMSSHGSLHQPNLGVWLHNSDLATGLFCPFRVFCNTTPDASIFRPESLLIFL